MSGDWLVTRKLAARAARLGAWRKAYLDLYAPLLGSVLAAAGESAGSVDGSVAIRRDRRL